MRIVTLLACLMLLLAPHASLAAEKAKAQGQIDAARAAIEAFHKKSDGNKLVAADLESARSYLKKAEEAFSNGSTMFGLGDLNPEASQEVKFDTDMADLYLVLGQSRIDGVKAADELAVMSGQVAKMRAKVKVFDDRKAELEKLRANQVKYEATLKELGELKADHGRLAEKAGKLEKQRKEADAEIERLKAELAKRDLAAVQAAQATPPAPAATEAPAAQQAPQPPVKQ